MSAKIRNYIIAGLICLFSFLLIHSVQVIYSNVLLGVGIEKNTEGQYVISEISAAEEGYKQNLRLGDIIVQVNGVDVELADKVVRYNVLAQVQSVDIIRTSNEGNSIHMHVNIKNEYSLYHKFTQLVVPGVTLLFLMILSLFLYRKRAGERSAELLILFFLMVSVTYFAGYASSRSDLIGRITLSCMLPLIPVVFIHFLQVYLKRFNIQFISTFLLKVYYGLVILLSILTTFSLVIYSWDRSLYSFMRLFVIGFFVVGILYSIFKLLSLYINNRKSAFKSMFKIMLTGHVLAFTPFVLFSAVPIVFGVSLIPFEVTTIFLFLMPVTYFYLLTAKQLFDIDFAFNRFKYYLLIAFLPALMIVAVLAIIQSRQEYDWIKWVQMFLVVYLSITAFLFFKEKIDYYFRPRLFRELYHYQGSLERFSKQISKVMKRSDLEAALYKEINEILPVNRSAFFEIDEDLSNLAQIVDNSEQEINIQFVSISPVLKVGEVVQLQQGIALVIGRHKKKFHLLWIDHKKNHTKFNTDELNWLNTIANYASIVYENLYLIEGLIEDLEAEMKKDQHAAPWVLRLIFNLSENERRKLAADLHDSALQDQLIWLRRLETLISDHVIPNEILPELLQIKEGLLDVIHQIRETCNELRPPLLRETGIVKALEILFEYAQLQSNYIITFKSSPIGALSEDLVIALYRIVQELLRNAGKHAKANQIEIELDQQEQLYFRYKDDGVGMNILDIKESFQHMGLSGIKERVASLEGECLFNSEKGKGLEVIIYLPTTAFAEGKNRGGDDDDTYLVG
ncbi:ATP-binding protein [Paenibacillus sp. B2(2019)]|uniref:ATP-binding protein n=1 Tax=Paenibacillus sp. B2(2019) TaxID=2607754 RepID=UPI0011F1206A|nr:ATP-binding protein [Paenibacillus sp. B2(2019)]KAA1188685.1 histidine kinase [Paenibacillus sp. B2(2019)]